MTGPLTARAVTVAAATLGVCALAAAAVRLGDPHAAREALGFTFAGIPDRIGEAASILVNNLTALAAPGVAIALVLWSRRPGVDRVPARLARGVGIVVLGFGFAINTLLIGASVGAYGERMVSAMLPHGPIELAAYSLALAAFLEVRAGRLDGRRALAALATSAALLVIAAPVETYVA